jgi:CHAD domain-containing protein
MEDEMMANQEAETDKPVSAEDSSPAKADAHQAHNEHVRDLALLLFDRTRPLHELDSESRRVMEIAALLHHFSTPLTKKKAKPERAIRKALQKQLLEELPAEGIKVLAVVIATHQGKLKRKNYDRLSLSPTQQREALTIASLLRIASGLDDSRSQTTTIQQIEPERERLWIVVDGPRAHADAAVAQNNARLWTKIGYPKVKILESADAARKLLPYPDPTGAVGVSAADTLAEAGRKVMRFHFARLLANEEGTRLGEDIEALHDMRVATRRLRAAFQVFGEAFEPGALKDYLKGLRATGRALGGVRDLDVFLDKTRLYLDALPEERRQGLDPLVQELETQREDKRVAMLDYLDSQDYHTFKRQFNIFLSTPGAGIQHFGQDEPEPRLVSELAPVLIYTRLAAVRAYDPFIADVHLETLHALRIEFRKLRYAVEFFSEVLGKPVENVIEEFKRLQEHLGDLNDANVAGQIVGAVIQKMGKEAGMEDMEPVHTYQAARVEERDRLVESFPAVWARFNSTDLRRRLAEALAPL